VHTSPPEPMAVVFLFDNSMSSDDPEISERFNAVVNEVLETVGDDGRGAYISGYLIDDNPRASPYDFDEEVDSKETNETELVYRSRVEQRVAEVRAAAEELIAHPTTKPGTAITEALVLAQGFFEEHPEAEGRYLIVCSDMIEESPRLDGSMIRSPEEREAFIEAEREAERLPDLDGVEAYVVSAGVTAGDEGTSEAFMRWEEFWLGYFEAAGADLPASRYGATLGRFPPAG
jgi:hypothetical protein